MTPEAHATRARYLDALRAHEAGEPPAPVVSELGRPSFVTAALAGIAVGTALVSFLVGVLFA